MKFILAALLLAQTLPANGQSRMSVIEALPEEAPFLRYTAPMYPYMLQYVSCLFNEQKLEANVRIMRCKDKRHAIESDASVVLEKWHAIDNQKRVEQFVLVLNDLEIEVRLASIYREPVPDAIVIYLECVGDYIVDRKGYRKGLYIEYGRADGECRRPVRDAQKSDETGETKAYYQRFQMRGLSRKPTPKMTAYEAQGEIGTITNKNGLLEPDSER